MNTLPCKDCITFSICKSKELSIQCDLLDVYLTYEKLSNKERYKKIREIEKIFNKEIMTVSYYYKEDKNSEYRAVIMWYLT